MSITGPQGNPVQYKWISKEAEMTAAFGSCYGPAMNDPCSINALEKQRCRIADNRFPLLCKSTETVIGRELSYRFMLS